MLKKFGRRLKQRDGWRCFYCWIPLQHQRATPDFSLKRRSETGKGYPTVDHLIPVASGGDNKLENLVLCCRQCNDEKGTTNWKKFYDKKKNARKNR